jgi:hypothetical protein
MTRELKMFGKENKRAIVFEDKKNDIRVERGYIPKGKKQIRDTKSKHFKNKKEALQYAKDYVKGV